MVHPPASMTAAERQVLTLPSNLEVPRISNSPRRAARPCTFPAGGPPANDSNGGRPALLGEGYQLTASATLSTHSGKNIGGRIDQPAATAS
jgi:hypothetical protein